ncbi:MULTISPECIES: glycosyltransferase family 4 protein [unclassified Leptolyngbya]|uniref:glycosyltransferase family 4 protein n=1 Tax=unclassified Leptolyngbya TaxID=2650499 RepID=UPI00168808AC|nr:MULTISPECIES: glycosyltransferase family 4 protein [unclassified Leptolyngbya]MBD1912360.1 glycosyltransferase [Leptolyngbya sp. FACHB-8]MBD2158004.1 glycosyltransferase [Leptolyngbya sp. FACHB-16]
MKVALLSTNDVDGGAARATYRLHLGLQQIGVESSLVVRSKRSPDPQVYATDTVYSEEYVRRMGLAAIQSVFIDQDRSDLTNTLFSLPYPGVDLSQFPQVMGADVIHLHWVSRFQSVTTLQRLLQLGKPAVWTLHDCSAFTGGCHYPAGCDRYQTTCHACPQLAENPADLPAYLLRDKLALLQSPITVVTPSQWLADCARQSALFRQQRIEVIPYGLETDVFRPWPKGEAKRALELDEGAIALLIGANNGNEQRKGFLPLFKALQQCRANPQFESLIEAGKVTLLCFGAPSEDLETLQIPVRSFGTIDSDETLSQLYAAADLFILPSLEDNLPNTMLEAMACGTPVIAFASGGIPDAVPDGQTGALVPPGDLEALAQAIVTLTLAPEQRQTLGETARRHVEANYALTLQAERYQALYADLPSPPLVERSPADRDMSLDTSMGPHFATLYPDLAQEALLRERRALEKRLDATQERWEADKLLLQQTKQDLHETRSVLHEKRLEVQKLRPEVQRLQKLRPEVQRLRPEVQKLRERLANQRQQVSQLGEQLVHTQEELVRSQAKIAEMEGSRFWKLRNAWFRLKQLGRNSEP